MRGGIVHAGAVVAPQVVDGQRSILRARGDQHTASAQRAPLRQLDRIGPLGAVQAGRLAGDAQGCAEFLGLRQGSTGQRRPRDAGRKSEVIFDLRAGPRLAAGRERLDDAHPQTFRGGIDGGRQAGGTGAHDYQIIEPAVIELRIDAEAFGDVAVAWVAEHVLAAADDHGNVIRPDMKALEQRRHIGIALDIDVVKGLRIARQERLQAQRIRRMPRTEQQDLAPAAAYERHATQNERAHQQLAELRIGLYERADLLGFEGNRCAVLPHAQTGLRRAAAQRAHLAAEVTGREQIHQLGTVAQQHLDAAGQHDEDM